MKLRVNLGHASAQKLGRVSVVSYEATLRGCGVGTLCGFRDPDEAPRLPITAPPAVSIFSEELRAELFFSGDVIALHAMDVLPEYSLLMPARPKNPQEILGALRNSRIGVSGPPQSVRMDEGGEWKNGVWAELRSERRITLRFQIVGAHPRIL